MKQIKQLASNHILLYSLELWIPKYYSLTHAPSCLQDKENFSLPSWMQVKWPEFQLPLISLEIIHYKKWNIDMQGACILGRQDSLLVSTFLGVSVFVAQILMIKRTTTSEQNFSPKIRSAQTTISSYLLPTPVWSVSRYVSRI